MPPTAVVASSIQQRTGTHSVRAGLAGLLLAVSGMAGAQEAGRDESSSGDMLRRSERALQWGGGAGFGLVEIAPAGPNQRPRRALRMRFDSATRAMRSLGVEAEDCSSLIRSTSASRGANGVSGDRPRIGLSVALSCRFF
jgi:hypothetical protein